MLVFGFLVGLCLPSSTVRFRDVGVYVSLGTNGRFGLAGLEDLWWGGTTLAVAWLLLGLSLS